MATVNRAERFQSVPRVGRFSPYAVTGPGKRAVTGDAALRFGHWFGIDPQFWLNLQSAYDIRVAEEKMGRVIARLPVRHGMSGPAVPSIA
jgi:hypothetical protein